MTADIHYLPLKLTDFKEHNPMAEQASSQIIKDSMKNMRDLAAALKHLASVDPHAFRMVFAEGSGIAHVIRRVRVDLDFIERTIDRR